MVSVSHQLFGRAKYRQIIAKLGGGAHGPAHDLGFVSVAAMCRQFHVNR